MHVYCTGKISLSTSPEGWKAPPKKDTKKKKGGGAEKQGAAPDGTAGQGGEAADAELDPEKAAKKVGRHACVVLVLPAFVIPAQLKRIPYATYCRDCHDRMYPPNAII